MKKQIILSALVLTVISTGLMATGSIFAQSTDSTSPMSTLVQKIANKFGLKTADVQAVFDQERTERHQQMEANFEKQLTQLVTDGKITEAQKQLLLAKHKEIAAARQTEMKNMQGLTNEERKTAMEAKRTQMKKERATLEEWATQNGVDVTYLMGGFGMRGGHKGPGGFENNPNLTPPATQ